ncbi:uncharacterized protein LOC108679805 [Hyalella azteca]|uniref:Gamma-aminobutyric acid type B receptor subunit 2 n=1 Tax=Hyalella azteca TaxID=294128 RepID=A0A979FX51_HYAAZ|nr:uncharacterized protein LOC108679805 [Hyalella azteca]
MAWFVATFLLFDSLEDFEGLAITDVEFYDLWLGFLSVSSDSQAKSDLGRGVMPALDLGVKHVNDHPTILRNYKLHVVWNDTECNTAIATKAFFDLMFKEPVKVMLFGAACTHVTDPIAKASKHWRITQLSYADTHPMFSAVKYPNFFRMAPSENEFNLPRLQLLRTFNWTRIGTLYQNKPRHALSHNHLLSLLDNMDGYEIAEAQSFADELKDQLNKLIEKDVRIILGNFDEDWARRIFCEAYRKKMYGKNYQWIITGMYREEWWALDEEVHGPQERETHETTVNPGGHQSLPNDTEGKCAVEEIMAALEGCIMTDLLPISSHDRPTVSGKNVSQYESEYNAVRKDQYSRFHAYTYDGVWSLALAIQAVGHKLHRMNHKNKTYRTVQDFRYRDPIWETLFREALSEVHFEGVTGPVQFTEDNTREGYILLKQFQGGREVAIGVYDGFEKSLDLDKKNPIYWPGGQPAKDRTTRIIEKNTVNIHFYVVLVTISSLGIVMAAIFLSINIHYRNQRYIKMSSPYLNNLIIIGCILTYTSVILLGLDSELTSETSFPYICTARAWVLMAGFTLAFGSMFSKTWRVHSIFTDVQLNKKVIKDYQLFIVVFVLLCFDIAIMTTWQIVDPFYRHTKLMPAVRGDIDIIPMNEYCKSEKISIFVGCIYAYKGLLMIFGCLLAWETRTVDIPALNDSKYIGMSVYNVVIMCVIGVPISYILSDDQDASYIIISVFIIFCTTGTLWLVFVPKLIELKRNPSGAVDKRIAIRTTLKPPKRQESESDVSDLHDQMKKAESERQMQKQVLRDKEQELQVLLLKYGDEILEEIAAEKVAAAKILAAAAAVTEARGATPDTSRAYFDIGWEGPSTGDAAEITEETSLCSSHNAEYVTSHYPLSTLTTSTTSIHHTQLTTNNHTHVPNSNNNNLPVVPIPAILNPFPDDSNVPKLNVRSSSEFDPTATAPPEITPNISSNIIPDAITSPEHSLIETSTSEIVNSTSKDEDLDRVTRSRGVSFVSPSQTPRDISKSVSFRLEGGYTKSEGQVECIAMQDLAPPPPHPILPSAPPSEPAPALPPRGRKAQERLPPISSVGYSSTYCHDYNPGIMQHEMQLNSMENPPLPPRMDQPLYPAPQYPPGVVMSQRVDMESALDRRMSYGFGPIESAVPSMSDEQDYHYNEHGIISSQRRHDSRRQSRGNEFPLLPMGSSRMAEGQCPDNYSQVPRNVYVPLNNLDDRTNFTARRPPDLTIVNNTMAGAAPTIQKNSNIRANMNLNQRVSTSRRASEPPHLIGADSYRVRNRSNEELNPRIPLTEADFEQEYKEDWTRRRDMEERESSRSISRSRLRRDSFGEVVSRRSPSQDSIGISRGSRSSPLLDRPQLDEPSRDRYTPAHDTWSVTGPSSRASPTHDSPEHQWVSGGDGGRAASEESLATMSSRGSIYSVTSARSDALPRRHFRAANARATRPNPLPHLPPFILNGEMSDSVASSDDIANPTVRGSARELMSLHRTTSEPHYNFEHLELENRLADPVFLLEQQRQMEGRGGTLALGGTLPRHHPHYQDPTSDYPTAKGRGMDGSGVSAYTSSLRGRSFSGIRSRATTSSVAAALMASKARNVSDNALDHSTSILPIFQKLLSERQRGIQSGRRDCAMSSCPNITIKCDIVEYL